MKEYGGYLELYNFTNDEYHKNAIALNNGRNALTYLIRARNIRKIYLPYFLCDSVYTACQKEGIELDFYRINKLFLPIFEEKLSEDEYLYLVNYYGQLDNDTIQKYVIEYKNVIVDNVQAFFQTPIKDVDTIYSCRKFFGVPDGSYLYTNSVLEEELEVDQSYDRMIHILGRYEDKASKFYDAYKFNDAHFVDIPLRLMSKLTHNLMRAISYNDVIDSRNTNFAMLHKALKGINKLQISTPIGPYCYPLYVENGDELRKKLIEKKIYVPILWPNSIKTNDPIGNDYSVNILPVPCDQRYDKNDIMYISQTIINMLNKRNYTE